MNFWDELQRKDYERFLKNVLHLIQIYDPSSKETFAPTVEGFDDQYYYDLRNEWVHDAVFYARKMDLKAGYLVHTPVTDIIDKGWDYRWGVVAYIELPTGQISWHIESPDIQYDGHGYEEKVERINNFITG